MGGDPDAVRSDNAGAKAPVSFAHRIAYHRAVMPNSLRAPTDGWPSLPFVLLCIFLAVLWIAGGASFPDQMGQVVVRATAWLVIATTLVFGTLRREVPVRPIAVLLGLAVILASLQLVPLPPSIWRSLPGREAVMPPAGELVSSWRPLSLVFGGTLNAVMSFVVPAATLLLLAGCREHEVRRWLPAVLLCVVVAAMLLGLQQLSGAGGDNPLINERPGDVSGSFANRNHFALFLAIGCALVPAWALGGGRRPKWRGPLGLALVSLFAMMILAVGSRGGLLLGAVALAAAVVFVRQGLGDTLRRLPRWVFPAVVGVASVVIVGFLLITVMADRAATITRILGPDPGQDMRTRGLSTVLGLLRDYFPIGSGFGGFTTIFGGHEPFGLLKPTYFNHAHNDFVEVGIDAGLPGMLLLGGAILWWAMMSIRAWRHHGGASGILPRLGALIVLLVLVSSLFDYPARTPMIMAVIVIAGVWLAVPVTSALPHNGR